MSRFLRVLGWATRAILVLLATLLLCLFLLLVAISTEWGGARLGTWAGRIVSKEIQGELRIESIRLVGFVRLAIEGIQLRDPQGNPAASLPELRIELAPGSLLSGRLHARQVDARGLRIEETTAGGRLMEALRPAESAPAPKEPELPSAPVPMEVDHLQILDATLSILDAEENERQIHVEDIQLLASGWWERKEGAADVSLSASPLQPVRLPLRIETHWRLGEDLLHLLPSELILGASPVDVSGVLAPRTRALSFEAEGQALPADLQRFRLPAAAPLSFSLEGKQGRGGTEVVARVQAPAGGTVRVEGTMSERGALDTKLQLFAVDPARWLEGAPRARFDGEGRLRGKLRPEPLLHGELALRSPRPRVDLSAEGSYEGRRLRIDRGRIQLPGGKVLAVGTIDPAAVDLQASLHVEDLNALLRAVGDSLDRRLPPARGQGGIRIAALGSPASLRFSLTGRFPALSVGAGAPALPLRFDAGGEVQPGALRVERFSMEHPGGAQRLGAPARLEWGPDTLQLRDLRLQQRGGGTRRWSEELRGEGRLAGAGGKVEASGRNFHLEHLPPHFFGGPLLGLRGVLDFELRATGPWRRPEGALRLSLRRAAFEGLEDLAAEADLRGARGRVAGTARLAAGGLGRVDVEGDLPLRIDRAPSSSALSLRVLAAPVDLAQVEALLGGPAIGGILRAALEVEGSLAAPRIELRGRVAGLHARVLPELPHLDLALAATTRDARLEARAEAWREGSRFAHVELGAPVDAGAWRRDPRAALEALLRAPATRLRGELRGFELVSLASLAGWEGVGGRASSRFDLRGPARAPLGELRVEVEGGPLGPFRDLDGAVLLRSTEAALHCEGRLAAEKQPPLRWSASLGTSAAALLARRVPARTPFALHWSLQPLHLEAFSLADRLRGRLQSSGSFQGSLEALEGAGRLRVEGLALHGEAIGGADLRLHTGREGVQGALFALDPTEGYLIARMQVREREWLPLLLAGAFERLRESEGRVELRAEGLSLRPLVLIGPVRRAEGALSGSLAAEGRLASLLPLGTLSLRRGAVELPGGPLYDRIEFDTRWEREGIRLLLLEAHSGKGLATARGDLRYGPSARFAFELRADVLPVGGSNGAVGALSTRGHVRGALHRQAGLEARVELGKTRFDLAPLQSRNLETPGRIEDVLIVTGPQAARRRAEARRREAPTVLPVRVQLAVAEPVQVRGPDLALTADVELLVHRERQGPFLGQGAVRVREGSVSLLGRPFVIEPSTVRWSESPIDNPGLDLSARYDAFEAVAWIEVSGTARQPEVDLRSEPPMSEARIAQLIATGRSQAPPGPRSEGPSAGTTAQEQQVAAGGAAASLLGSVAATALQQRLAPALPIDVIAVESTEESTAIQAGTYVGRRLFFGYARNLLPQPGENTNEVRVGYLLSRSIALQSRFGDAGNGGVDLVFQREFPSAAQKRAREEEGKREEEGEGDTGREEGEGEEEATPPAG